MLTSLHLGLLFLLFRLMRRMRLDWLIVGIGFWMLLRKVGHSFCDGGAHYAVAAGTTAECSLYCLQLLGLDEGHALTRCGHLLRQNVCGIPVQVALDAHHNALQQVGQVRV